MLVPGVAAVVRSVTATIASMLFFGWLLVIASGIEIGRGAMASYWAGFFHHLAGPLIDKSQGMMIETIEA